MHLLALTSYCNPFSQYVKEEYQEWMMLHPATEVEFEEREQPVADQEQVQDNSRQQYIRLEISAAHEGESKDWDIYPMNATEVIEMHDAFIIT